MCFLDNVSLFLFFDNLPLYFVYLAGLIFIFVFKQRVYFCILDDISILLDNFDECLLVSHPMVRRWEVDSNLRAWCFRTKVGRYFLPG